MAITRKPAYGYDDLNALYTQNLDRPASQDEYAGWVNGDYTGTPDDLNAISQQIYNSDEAQGVRRRKAPTSGTNPPAPPTQDYGNNAPPPSLEEIAAARKATPAGPKPSDYDLGQSMLTRLNAPGQTTSYKDLVDEFNSGYGMDYKAYDDSRGQTIGLHTGYLAKTPNGWTWTQRGPETGGGGGGGGMAVPNPYQLPPLPTFSSTQTGPGTSGVFNSPYLQQLGQDPFSQSIAGGITTAMDAAAARLHSTPQQRATAMEGARAPYEAARKVQLANAEAALADRGTLGEPGHQSGLLSSAVGRIETDLAPAYTGAIANAMSLLDQNEQQAVTQLLQGASTGTQRQQVLSDVALRELDQNRLWNQFLAQFGLDRDKAMYDVQLGQGQQLLQLFALYLQQAQQAANGYV